MLTYSAELESHPEVHDCISPLLGSFLMPSVFGPLLTSATVVIADDLEVSITKVVELSGCQL